MTSSRNDPFVGRTKELAAVESAIDETLAGRGRVIALTGEPGIGKTRLARELTERAAQTGAVVLWGGSHEGEWAPAYGPFVEALTDYVRRAEAGQLREALGAGAGVVSRIVPAVRERLTAVEEPVALQPDEERFRLFDAVSQFLIVTSARKPVCFIADDLQWADRGTVAMVRHLARFVRHHRILFVVAYRDGEIDASHPLGEALAAMRRETTYEDFSLKGFDTSEVGELLESIVAARRKQGGAWAEEEEEAVSPGPLAAAAISDQAKGNPFLARELIHLLLTENAIARIGDRWVLKRSLAQAGVPAGVRQLVELRLKHLSPEGRRLLQVASAFHGPFRWEIAARVAELDDETNLDTVDEALRAQLLRPGARTAAYEFTHDLIRQSIYGALNPSRQVRLHRRIAETMECILGEAAGEHSGEIANQYQRSTTLAGAERGAPHAIAAAERAEAASAFEEAARYWGMARRFLHRDDDLQARVLDHLSLALTWSLDFETALQIAEEAKERIASRFGFERTAEYLSRLARAMASSGFPRGAWACARLGLPYAEHRRDATWVRLMVHEIARREADDPENVGIPIESAERDEVARVAERLRFPDSERIFLAANGHSCPRNRAEAVRRHDSDPWWFAFFDRRRAIPTWRKFVVASRREGRVADTVMYLAYLARCENSIGDFAAARATLAEASATAARLTGPSLQVLIVMAARFELCLTAGEGLEELWQQADTSQRPPENAWALAAIQAATARGLAWLGRSDETLALVQATLKALDVAPGWTPNYPSVVCDVAEALWTLGRAEHADATERNLREKVLAPDLRYVLRDARRSIAHLCALQGRFDEAADWFAEARVVFDEQTARPLRAIVDYDEALMYVRRGAAGDRGRAASLLEKALAQFRAMGMPGWIRRGEHLLQHGEEWKADESRRTTDQTVASNENVEDRRREMEAPGEGKHPSALLRNEGDFWSVAFEGNVARVKASRGLEYLLVLLRHPGREIHVADLACGSPADDGAPLRRQVAQGSSLSVTRLDDAGPVHDAEARSAYKRRVAELREELEEAESFNDVGRASKLRAEMEALVDELQAGAGLGGRSRKSTSPTERARLNVTRALRTAVRKIGEHNRPLAEHLERSLKTGIFCSYDPDPRARIEWQL